MNLTEAMEAFSQGKKIRRVEWPGGAFLQLQGAFIPTPERNENFRAWIEDNASRKFILYCNGKNEPSRTTAEEVKKFFDLHEPMVAATVRWELAP